MMKTAATALFFLVSSPNVVVSGLKLQITDVTCDSDTYPDITATMAMTCNDGADTSCNMGEAVEFTGVCT